MNIEIPFRRHNPNLNLQLVEDFQIEVKSARLLLEDELGQLNIGGLYFCGDAEVFKIIISIIPSLETTLGHVRPFFMKVIEGLPSYAKLQSSFGNNDREEAL